MIYRMWKVTCILVVLTSAMAGQVSCNGSFSVVDTENKAVLTAAQMREAESIYENACAVVQHDFHSNISVHPNVVVIVGADRDLVHGSSEIWMTKWNREKFAQGIVMLLLFNSDLIEQLSSRAVRYSNATVNVSTIK